MRRCYRGELLHGGKNVKDSLDDRKKLGNVFKVF